MNNDFGITFRRKTVSTSDQITTQFLKIINFSIKHRTDCLIFVEYRLGTRNQINNTQPSHPQTQRPFDKHPLIIRTSMDDLPAHAVNKILTDWLLRVKVISTTDTAHNLFPSSLNAGSSKLSIYFRIAFSRIVTPNHGVRQEAVIGLAIKFCVTDRNNAKPVTPF